MSGVADHKLHILAWRKGRPWFNGRRLPNRRDVNVDTSPGPKSAIPRRQAGIARIHNEVHDHLLQLPGIRMHDGAVVLNVQIHRNFLTNDSAEQLLRALHQLPYAYGLRMDHLLPTEGQ